jgi:hypothetical protein
MQNQLLLLTARFPAFCCLLFGLSAFGQQTIFNVPVTDVLSPGKVYVELDPSWKISRPRAESFIPRIVVGVPGHIEVGVNFNGVLQTGPDQTVISPTAKWNLYKAGDDGLSITIGDHLYVPAGNNRSYSFGNYVYAEASFKFKTGTRVTFGGYHFSPNVVAEGAQRAGGQFGFEQGLTQKLSFSADWLTGKHALGYFTPGFAYTFNRRFSGTVGYSIGNADFSKGNHYLTGSFGYLVNP